jgi:hypothetical protein
MHTITGGTGHFAGAPGAFTIHRVVDQSTGGTSGAFDGTIVMTQYDERGWRATFYTTGMEHSPMSATGTGWERTPCGTW